MPKLVDLTGKKFGRWTVLKRDLTIKKPGAMWECECACGTKRTVCAQGLKNGDSSSCGCYNREVQRKSCIERNTTHKKSKTQTYFTWMNMIQRCTNPKNPKYRIYGHRGIRVCERWLKFENFLADMGERPFKNYSIDRINNNGNYEPENCRWASPQEQARNQTKTRLIKYNGKTQTLMEWAEETGIPHYNLHQRLSKLGWSIERALNEKAYLGKNQSHKEAIK